jgi:anti-sigma B factor antagonist
MMIGVSRRSSLDVHMSLEETGSTITVTGEIDIATADKVVQEATPLLSARRGADVVLDVAGVTFCDSAGLNALIRLKKLIAGLGGDFRIINSPVHLRRVLELSGLSEYLNVE